MMNPPSSLFLALRSFRPRENNDPLENFVTAAFTWLLQNHTDFSAFYLNQLTAKLGCAPVAQGTPVEWDNHANLGGVIPDLIGKAGTRAFVFEHKVGAPLHERQLENYRKVSGAEFKGGYHLVLITRHVTQHTGEADLELCWSEVHAWINQWLAASAPTTAFLFRDFCLLLEDQGMGPAPMITTAAMLSFFPARNFMGNLANLVHRAYQHDWAALMPPGTCEPFISDRRNLYWGEEQREGRLGFGLMSGDGRWSPGLFVGFLLDPADSGVKLVCEAVPDFSIIIDVNINQHPDYDLSPLYRAMVNELAIAVAEQCAGFEFHHHRDESKNPNRWHPIHIRMSMLELMQGTDSAEAQLRRLIEKTSSVLTALRLCPSFWAWREELRKQAPTTF